MDSDYVKVAASMVLPYRLNGKDGFVYVKTAKDGKWGLPGGSLEPFENSMDGSVREVFEESGLEVEATGFLGVWDFRAENGNSISNRIYSGYVVGGELFVLNPSEILDIGVFSFEELRKLYSRNEIRAGVVNIEPVESFITGRVYPLSIVRSFF